MLFSDIGAVFFNGDEHAEEHNVDGKDVLVILEKDDVRDHSAPLGGRSQTEF